MSRMSLLSLAALAAVPTAAGAQDQLTATVQLACLLGDMRFSPGAVVRAANEFKLCTDAFTWEATDELPMGCFYGGEFYSVGAAREIASKITDVVLCLETGDWKVIGQ